MFGWTHLIKPPPPSEVWNVDGVRDWLSQNGVRARVEPRDGERAVAVTTYEGQATVFTFPIPVGSLRWILQGNP